VLLVFALWMTAVFMLNKLQILSIIFNVRLTCNKQIKSVCSDLKRNSNFLSEKMSKENSLLNESDRWRQSHSNFTFLFFQNLLEWNRELLSEGLFLQNIKIRSKMKHYFIWTTFWTLSIHMFKSEWINCSLSLIISSAFQYIWSSYTLTKLVRTRYLYSICFIPI
jgi:hypothetical protein